MKKGEFFLEKIISDPPLDSMKVSGAQDRKSLNGSCQQFILISMVKTRKRWGRRGKEGQRREEGRSRKRTSGGKTRTKVLIANLRQSTPTIYSHRLRWKGQGEGKEFDRGRKGNEGKERGSRRKEEKGRRKRESPMGLCIRLGTGRGEGSGARMSSSSNIRVGVWKRRSQMLDADTVKVTKAKRQ